MVTANPLTNPRDGSVGLLLPNLEARIVDPDTGKDSAEGEIWVRGPNVVLGYLNNPKANEETFDAEGYIHTGDVVKVDAEGYWYIVDRIKELIKVKGLQVGWERELFCGSGLSSSLNRHRFSRSLPPNLKGSF